MARLAWSAGTLATHGPLISGLHRISSLDPTLCWTRVEDIYTPICENILNHTILGIFALEGFPCSIAVSYTRFKPFHQVSYYSFLSLNSLPTCSAEYLLNEFNFLVSVMKLTSTVCKIKFNPIMNLYTKY